jgi:hypothetical protein
MMDTSEHQKVCPGEDEKCGLCDDRMPRRLLEAHMRDPAALAKHVSLLASHVSQLRAENAELKKRATCTPETPGRTYPAHVS